MNIDKHTWTRAFRKALHERLIRGVVNGIARDYSPEQFMGTKYQILHMFLNAGVSKKTLVITHHRRFTGKNKAYEWCSSYLRHSAHCMYAEKRQQERRDEGIYPYEAPDVIKSKIVRLQKQVRILEDKLQDM